MDQILSDKELLIQALQDSGLSGEAIATCCGYYDTANHGALQQELSRQKAQLLADLHLQQKQIDCLDYLTYTLKKNLGGTKQ